MDELTPAEIWILYNQYLLLEKLAPQDYPPLYEHDPDQGCASRVALKNGFTLDYPWFLREKEIQKLIEADQILVRKILTLYHDLHLLNTRLSAAERLDEKSIRFKGFSGNAEHGFIEYCLFVIHNENFEFFKDRTTVDSLNSHYSMVDTYRRQIKAFEKFPFDAFTRADLEKILAE